MHTRRSRNTLSPGATGFPAEVGSQVDELMAGQVGPFRPGESVRNGRHYSWLAAMAFNCGVEKACVEIDVECDHIAVAHQPMGSSELP